MSIPFTVIEPMQVTDATLVSTTVPEDDEMAYSDVATYGVGDRVLLGAPQHAIYESLSSGNLGKFPTANPADWIYVGLTNAWKAFDLSGGTVLEADGSNLDPLEFVITGNRLNAIGLIGLQASWVRIKAESAVEGVYYDETTELLDSALLGNWFDYFFTDISKSTELIVLDIPPIMNSEYSIQIADASGTVKLSTFVIGQSVNMGFTEFGAQIGIIDYSRKTVDQFGRASLEQRAFSDRMSVSMELPKGIVDSVRRKFTALRAKPCLWIGANGQYESLTVFGFYRDFNIDISYPTISICSAEIEGLS